MDGERNEVAEVENSAVGHVGNGERKKIIEVARTLGIASLFDTMSLKSRINHWKYE